MAITILDGPSGLFDPYTRDKASLSRILKLAMFGQPKFPKGTALATQSGATVAADLVTKDKETRTAQTMLSKAMGRRAADFTARFTTGNADALASVFALSGSSGKGVTFPAGTVRTIQMVMRSANDADRWYQIVEQDVYGNDGTTPVLADQRLISAYGLDAAVFEQQGEVTLKTVVAVEDTDGTSSTGIALAAFSSGAAALSFPPCRAADILGIAVSQNAYEAATSPAAASISALAPTSGTATLTAYVTGTGAATDPPAADLVHVQMRLWPLPQVALALATNDVQVHARSALNDVLTHELEVYVGTARVIALGA